MEDKTQKIEVVKVKPKYVAQTCPGCHGFTTCGYDKHLCPACKGAGYILIEAEESK